MMKHSLIGIIFVGIFLLIAPQTLSQSGQSERCITKVGNPDPTTSPSPGPLGCSKSGGGAGNYKLPLDSATSIFTEMGAYGGNYQWGGHTEHAGLDIGTNIGGHDPVYAVADGTVAGIYNGGVEITNNSSCPGILAGCTIRLVHTGDSFTSWYTHTDPIVTKGTVINKGDHIGDVHIWSDGNDHLHFELRETSTNQNIQPRNYFPELNQIPVPVGYEPNIRAHSASRGIYLLEDGLEFAERFRDHPPCPGDCWAF